MKHLKKIIFSFIFSLLWVHSTQAQESQTICIQVIQPAINAYGECRYFPTPCDVPTEWRAIPSCSVLEKRATVSLEEKLKKRTTRGYRKYNSLSAEKKRSSSKPNNSRRKKFIGSGAQTRTYARKRRLPTSLGAASHYSRRTFSPTIQRGSTHNKKPQNLESVLKTKYNDYQELQSLKSIQSNYYRPSIISRTKKTPQNTGVNTIVNWSTIKNQAMRKRSFGHNPYSLRSRYAKTQKENRDRIEAQKKRLNAKARNFSRSRTWRDFRSRDFGQDTLSE